MRTLSASDRTVLLRMASELPPGTPARRAILAGLRKAAAVLPWMSELGLKPQIGVLKLFIAKPEYALYLSPGPMNRAGNFEYVLERRDGKLHHPTEEEIASYRRGMAQTTDAISRGEVAWWQPAGNLYQFGVSVIPVEGIPNWYRVQRLGRPNNAQGYSLDLRRGAMSGEDVLRVLSEVSTERGIRRYLSEFEGLPPKYLQ
jgi:hypothetical protein